MKTQSEKRISTGMKNARPIESGTKRKWKDVVIPNCHLARSNASMPNPLLAGSRVADEVATIRGRTASHARDVRGATGPGRVARGSGPADP